jgi:hypothetical protein
MSASPSDHQSGAIKDGADQVATSSSLKVRLVGATFVTLAGVAMVGWLYLIAKVLWVSVGWLAF